MNNRWHTEPAPRVLEALDASEHGLSNLEAGRRRERYGPNTLPEKDPPRRLVVFARQFKSPLIFILAVAGVMSLGVGEFTDAGFIFGVLVLNALIGGFQEWRAETASRALQRLVKTRATVTRDGETREVDGEELVPGDVVWLESGNRVPADLRLLAAHALEIDESLLTGESLAVLKDAHWTGPLTAPLGDRVNQAFAGAVVVRGRGRGVVVATGAETEVGQLAVGVAGADTSKPPLLLRLERFTRVIGIAVLVAAAFAAFLGVAVQNRSVEDMFLLAVALAVSAIPEGLPVALTVALAVAMTRMSRRGVLVRRLAAVEGLGSCTLIATDKTGTLTCNELTAQVVELHDGRRLRVSGEGYAPVGHLLDEEGVVPVRRGDPVERLARTAALCNEGSLLLKNDAWTWHGDPTDIALLSLAHKAEIQRPALVDELPEITTIPFEPELKYAASYHQEGDRVLVAVKGAPERVLGMCAFADEADHRHALERAAALASEGFRVLAFAEGHERRPVDPEHVPPEPAELDFLGFVGMIDPLRPGVRDAIARCHAAGIAVKMITGDHPITALAISRELGLAHEPGQVIAGPDLAAASPEEQAELIRSRRVFARVSPQQKLDIVEAARAAGEFVAVTGDGVNDAPALRSAHIGVAMGRGGTDAAREAAELVISDDDFATIVAGVEEGRVAFDNVRKVIFLLVSTGAAEVVLVTIALAAGLPIPLLPVQLLWLNLVTNGIQHIGLALEPKESDVLRRPPRPPGERIFNRLMVERTLVAALVMGGVAFGAFSWMMHQGWAEGEARNALLLLMVLFENVHVGNSRSETQSLFRLDPRRSPILVVSALAALGVHVIAMYIPAMQSLLGTAPLRGDQWLAVFALALSIAVAMELHKLSWWLRTRAPAGRARDVSSAHPAR